MSRLNVLKSLIADELRDIETLMDELPSVIDTEPTNVVRRACGSILHDFYTGVEKIFREVATSIDEHVPAGESWHTDLLRQMTLRIEGVRDPVVEKRTAEVLEEYLRFRHLYRNIYGFQLRWKDIKRLVEGLPEVFSGLRDDLDLFLKNSEEEQT